MDLGRNSLSDVRAACPALKRLKLLGTFGGDAQLLSHPSLVGESSALLVSASALTRHCDRPREPGAPLRQFQHDENSVGASL